MSSDPELLELSEALLPEELDSSFASELQVSTSARLFVS